MRQAEIVAITVCQANACSEVPQTHAWECDASGPFRLDAVVSYHRGVPMSRRSKRLLFAVAVVAGLVLPVASAQAAIGAMPVLSASWPTAFAFDNQRIFYVDRFS